MKQHIAFKSKAQNLKSLQNILQSALILPFVITSLNDIKHNKKTVLSNIKNLNTKSLIVRSSSSCEDSTYQSFAGAFLSLSHIPNTQSCILEAIKKVGDSMLSHDDEILIQPMLQNITLCGVAFSIDKENSAPYYTISYDKSGLNDGVTSGKNTEIVHFCHYRHAPLPADTSMASVVALIRELEQLFNTQSLDIEFAFSEKKLYCLQVRPLVMKDKPNLYSCVTEHALSRLSKRIDFLNQAHPHILGKRAIYGVMPDWNPAEMIGLKPKRLALSLYKEIITDNIWAYQRDNYGYRNLRSYPLMHSFLGIPYIDVRISFNSFIPKKLDENIARKLVDYYLETLAAAPQLHDKIEFEIIFSCYDLNTPAKLKKLLSHGFNDNEIKRIEFALLELTNSILNPTNGLYHKDLTRAELLSSRYDAIMNANLSIYDRIYWLIEDCKRFGTLPFAGIARAAFVSMQILNALVEIDFLTQEEKDCFLLSLNTISKELTRDIQQLKNNNKEEFLQKYGHLRAGSYDILSPRYDESFETYFENIQHSKATQNQECIFHLEEIRLKELKKLLNENGLHIEPKDLFIFFKETIQGREKVKFAFSKLLSQSLKLIKELGENLGISAEDMAHLDIKNILSLYSSLYKDSPKERLLNEIRAHKEEFKLTTALKLPPLILKGADVFSFYAPKISPNFITQKSVFAQTATQNDRDIKGKIILIPSADPGFDYLFTKDIVGLITCYGGANSHMAIRASELGLPSVIGVGEENFSRYIKAYKIRIECESQQIFCFNL